MKRIASVVTLSAASALAGSFAVGCDDAAIPAPAARAAGAGGATGAAGGSGGGGITSCPPIGAANEVAADDPRAAGQCAFLHDAWGTEALDSWPPADFMLGLMESEPAVFGDQFASFGFLPDPNDDFPIGFKRGLVDPTKVHETCALCHIAELPDGRLWFGAPNGNLDFGRFTIEMSKRWVAAGNEPLLSPLAETKAAALGPGRANAESLAYPYAVPADFPPYFRLSERENCNYLGTGRNVRTEVFFSIYTFGAGSPNAETAKVPFPSDERLEPFLQFFGTMAAPAGPAPDSALVAQGKSVFGAARCGSCHHVDDLSQDEIVTYDKDPAGLERYPGDDPSFPRGSIRTDVMHRVLIDDSVGPEVETPEDPGTDDGFANLIEFIGEHGLSVLPTDGYRTSELRGLWATAPYLHNGSVPTLEDLLEKASDRPSTWMRGSYLVDTTLLSNSNMGHEFGTDLSEADKAALVAYLMSL